MKSKNITSLELFSKNNKINIITSFPKSGNTWMRFIIYDLLFNKENISIDNSRIIKDRIPDLHNLKILDNKIFNNFLNEKNIFFKTHFSFQQMKKLKLQINKVIVVVRNPFDIFISLFNFYEISENQKDEMIDYFCSNHTLPFLNKFNLPNWEDHLKSWINSGEDYHIVKYSNLINNFENQIKNLSDFLDIKVTDEKINFIKNNTKFENLKRIEILEREKNQEGFFTDSMRDKKSQFMNKGGYGNYKSFFNDSELKKLKRSFKKQFEDFEM